MLVFQHLAARMDPKPTGAATGGNPEVLMKPDKTTTVVSALCMAAIAVALYTRTAIYPTAPSRSGPAVRKTGGDTYNRGRIIIHFHERQPYYISNGQGVGGIVGDRITFVFEQAGIPLAWQKTPAKRQLDSIEEPRSKRRGIFDRKEYGLF